MSELSLIQLARHQAAAFDGLWVGARRIYVSQATLEAYLDELTVGGELLNTVITKGGETGFMFDGCTLIATPQLSGDGAIFVGKGGIWLADLSKDAPDKDEDIEFTEVGTDDPDDVIPIAPIPESSTNG